MLYTDLLFVFVFMPLTVIVSLFDRSAEYKNLILVISSVIFFTWGRPAIILLLFVTVIADYLLGLGADCKKRPVGVICLIASIIMNGGFFVVFARNFLFDKGGLLGRFSQLSFAEKLIPLGIAYYTLRGVGYVFDVFRKNTEVEKNPFCLLTYMLSYHFMFVGPVVRYNDIRKELRERKVGFSEINDGLTRFVYGLGKAVVVAPVFKKLMEAGLVFENLTTAGAVFGMIGFLGYYFWSFWGYTDMALGLGLMNGFHYTENMLPFNFTKGLSDTAYAFNGTVTKRFCDLLVYRGEKKILYVITGIISALFVGLWYGFYKGAVAGALFIGIFVISEKLFLKDRFDKIPKAVVGLYTAVITLGGACMFCFDAFWKGRKWLFALIGKADGIRSAAVTEIITSNWLLIAFGIVFALPIVREFFKSIGEEVSKKGGYAAIRILQTVFVAVVFAMYTVLSYHGVK
ncbi:MAG: hypothetical protein E7509_03615 [Ruminococcus sp.]|nr:hypothetical protein [Ruminococcus sp.]